jgi:hypothetical protein
MIASPIPATFAECGDRGLAEQGRHNRDRAVLQMLRSREKNWPPLLRLTATRTVANSFLLPCSAAQLSVKAKGYDIRVSPLAKDDSEFVRGHVISLLQFESFGGREKRDILQIADAPFRVLGLEQLVEGFVAR